MQTCSRFKQTDTNRAVEFTSHQQHRYQMPLQSILAYNLFVDLQIRFSVVPCFYNDAVLHHDEFIGQCAHDPQVVTDK